MIEFAMERKILQIGSPKLEIQSRELKKKEIKSKKIQALVDDLVETAEVDIEKSAGLSAPQVGENLNVFVARRFDLEGEEEDLASITWEVVINPKITKEGKKQTTFWEGCLSVGLGDDALFGPVNRPRKISIEYLNRKGEKLKMVAQDFMSHVLQHEVDHLKGILFLSHINNPENVWRSDKLDEYMKKHKEFPKIK